MKKNSTTSTSDAPEIADLSLMEDDIQSVYGEDGEPVHRLPIGEYCTSQVVRNHELESC